MSRAERAAVAARRFRSLDARFRRSLTRRLRAFFRAQAGRVVRRYLYDHTAQVKQDDPNQEPETIAPSAEELLPDNESDLLWFIIQQVLLGVIQAASSLAGGLVGLPGLAEADARVQEILKDMATRVADIDQTTQEAIQRTLLEGIARGYTPLQIAYGVPEANFAGLQAVVSEVYQGRAATIARTEIARARNLMSIEMYRAARVQMCYVYDGTGCGWTTHNDPDKASGTERTLDECQAYPEAHPSCQRAYYPIVE